MREAGSRAGRLDQCPLPPAFRIPINYSLIRAVGDRLRNQLE
jgi:hypothetical protein